MNILNTEEFSIFTPKTDTGCNFLNYHVDILPNRVNSSNVRTLETRIFFPFSLTSNTAFHQVFNSPVSYDQLTS